jgi:peptidoglycan/xylan/chitin deacetylase (PgdA/CDA1 family)
MPTLALTFDDGPDPALTPRLLDVLEDAGATAMFFPIAPRAERQPTLVARMLAAGHTVGLHCDEHVRHGDRGRRWLEADTVRALHRLHDLGVPCALWRTPWGDKADWTAAVAAEHGLRLVGWTVDTHDWRGDSAGEMFAATRDGLIPEAIVLAHDGIGPGARRVDAAQTLAYVELVLVYAREHGLVVRSI